MPKGIGYGSSAINRAQLKKKRLAPGTQASMTPSVKMKKKKGVNSPTKWAVGMVGAQNLAKK